MGWINEISQIVQGVIMPDLKAVRTSLETLEKDIDRTLDGQRELIAKYDDLNARLARMEGAFASLEPALKTHVENLVLKSLPSSKR